TMTVQRAPQIILPAADGVESQEIAQRLCVSRTSVQLWRERFFGLAHGRVAERRASSGSHSCDSRPQGRRHCASHAAQSTTDATHWSTRLMAKTQGVSEARVRRIWRRHALKPHHISRFKVSRDLQFVQMLIGVVGLYLT